MWHSAVKQFGKSKAVLIIWKHLDKKWEEQKSVKLENVKADLWYIMNSGSMINLDDFKVAKMSLSSVILPFWGLRDCFLPLDCQR